MWLSPPKPALALLSDLLQKEGIRRAYTIKTRRFLQYKFGRENLLFLPDRAGLILLFSPTTTPPNPPYIPYIPYIPYFYILTDDRQPKCKISECKFTEGNSGPIGPHFAYPVKMFYYPLLTVFYCPEML